MQQAQGTTFAPRAETVERAQLGGFIRYCALRTGYSFGDYADFDVVLIRPAIWAWSRSPPCGSSCWRSIAVSTGTGCAGHHAPLSPAGSWPRHLIRAPCPITRAPALSASSAIEPKVKHTAIEGHRPRRHGARRAGNRGVAMPVDS
jgi:hypothetical protein